MSVTETDPRIIAGMATQGQALRRLTDSGARHLGWKAGLGTAAAMDKVGTTAPVAGFLTSDTLIESGGELDVASWTKPTFEPELSVRLGAGLRVDAIAPAIELVDLGAIDDLETVLAGNVFHRAFVLGDWLAVDDPSAVGAARLDVSIDGVPHATDVDPAAALGELVEVAGAVVAQVALSGREARAGDVIITGSAIGAVALSGAAELAVTLRGAGTVGVRVRA